MGDMNLIRLMEEVLGMGYRIEFEHVAQGVMTEVVVTKVNHDGFDNTEILQMNVPSNALRNPESLQELMAHIKIKHDLLA